jgi:RNA polymerase sigma-70 factor (ECF subfamily)
MDDRSLLRQLARDCDGSFECLVVTYQDRLYRFALRLSGSPWDAEEIAQDAFVKAYRALGEYSKDRIHDLALRPWLYQITLNVFRNRIRRRQLASVPLSDDVPLESQEVPPEGVVELAERHRELGKLLANLPQRYRASVILRHIDELQYSEIAQVLCQPEGTVKSNVHRGLHMLRNAIKDSRIEVTA